ncbi:MAG: hypothetical protein ACSI46_30235 [Gloeotrichia echinulata DVL01]
MLINIILILKIDPKIIDIAGDWGHNDRSVHRWGLGYKSDCV